MRNYFGSIYIVEMSFTLDDNKDGIPVAKIKELNKIECFTNKLISLLDLNLSYLNKEISYEWLFQIDLSKNI